MDEFSFSLFTSLYNQSGQQFSKRNLKTNWTKKQKQNSSKLHKAILGQKLRGFNTNHRQFNLLHFFLKFFLRFFNHFFWNTCLQSLCGTSQIYHLKEFQQIWVTPLQVAFQWRKKRINRQMLYQLRVNSSVDTHCMYAYCSATWCMKK